jgi:predicted deacylase
MQAIVIGSARAEGRGIVRGKLKTGVLPDGSPLEIPVVIARGAEDGPVLWLHGCVHGNEYCGAFTILELMRALDVNQLRGAVVALPILNLAAFQKMQRMSPFELYGGGDLNRCFPGQKDGPLTQQIGHAIYSHLKRYANFLIDYHTAFTGDTRWALYADVGGAVSEAGLGIAKAYGFKHTLPAPPTILGGSAMMAAAKDGIPAYIVESGGINSAFTRDLVRDGAERLRNVLRHLKMLPGAVTDYGTLTLFSNFAWCNAPFGGLFRAAVKPGDPIKKGAAVGTFYNLHGDKIGAAKAPASGIVLATHAGPVMPQGDTMVHIGLNPRQAA